MTMEPIAQRIKALAAEHFGVAVDSVTESTEFEKDLGADSLDHVELLMYVEDEFGIELPDEQVKDVRTVGQLIQVVEGIEKETA